MRAVVGWSLAQLHTREATFAGLVAKDVRLAVRTLTASLDQIITAATARQPPPPVPVVSPVPAQTAPSITTADMALVLAAWQGYVDQELYPYVVDTFMASAAATARGVGTALDVTLESLTSDYAEAFIGTARNRLVGIGGVVWNEISASLTEGYAAGEGIQQLAARVSAAAGVSTPRALTIARTEIISAANGGSLQQLLDAGFTDEECDKEWLATEDARTRPAHHAADHQRVPITQAFQVDDEGLQYPGDPTGSAGNVINCRCGIAFAFTDDAADIFNEEPVLVAADFVEKEHPRGHDGQFIKGAESLIDLTSGGTVKAWTKVIYTNKYHDGAVVAIYPHGSGHARSELTWDEKTKKFRYQEYDAAGAMLGNPKFMGKGEAYQQFNKVSGWHLPPTKSTVVSAEAGKTLEKIDEVVSPIALGPKNTELLQGLTHQELTPDFFDQNFTDGELVAVQPLEPDGAYAELTYSAKHAGFILSLYDENGEPNGEIPYPKNLAKMDFVGSGVTDVPNNWYVSGNPKISPGATTKPPTPGTPGMAEDVTSGHGTPLTKDWLLQPHPKGTVVAHTEGGNGILAKRAVVNDAGYLDVEYVSDSKWTIYDPSSTVDEFMTAYVTNGDPAAGPSNGWLTGPPAGMPSVAPVTSPTVPTVISVNGSPMKLGTKAIYTTKYAHGTVVARRMKDGNPEQLVWDDTKKKFILQHLTPESMDWSVKAEYGKGAAYKEFSGDTDWKAAPANLTTDLSVGPGDKSHAPASLPAAAPPITAPPPRTVKKSKPKTLKSVAEYISGGSVDISAYSATDRKAIVGTYMPGAPSLTNLAAYTGADQVLSHVFARLQALGATGKYPNVTALQMLEMIDTFKHTQNPTVWPVGHFRHKVVSYLQTTAGKAAATKLSVKYQAAGIVAPTTAKKLGKSASEIVADAKKAKAAVQAQWGQIPIYAGPTSKGIVTHIDTQVSLAKVPKPADISLPESRPDKAPFPQLTPAHAKKMQEKMLAGNAWTSAQKSGLTQYTGSSYSMWNNGLRNGTYVSPTGIQAIANTQAGMRPTTEDLVVYRGSTSHLVMGDQGESYNLDVSALEKMVGAVVEDKGFTSTSVKEDSAFSGSVRYIIEVPTGTPAAFVRDISHFKSEDELLLAAGTRFRVMEVTKKSGSSYGPSVIVRLRVVP